MQMKLYLDEWQLNNYDKSNFKQDDIYYAWIPIVSDLV